MRMKSRSSRHQNDIGHYFFGTQGDIDNGAVFCKSVFKVLPKTI